MACVLLLLFVVVVRLLLLLDSLRVLPLFFVLSWLLSPFVWFHYFFAVVVVALLRYHYPCHFLSRGRLSLLLVARCLCYFQRSGRVHPLLLFLPPLCPLLSRLPRSDPLPLLSFCVWSSLARVLYPFLPSCYSSFLVLLSTSREQYHPQVPEFSRKFPRRISKKAWPQLYTSVASRSSGGSVVPACSTQLPCLDPEIRTSMKEVSRTAPSHTRTLSSLLCTSWLFSLLSLYSSLLTTYR